MFPLVFSTTILYQGLLSLWTVINLWGVGSQPAIRSIKAWWLCAVSNKNMPNTVEACWRCARQFQSLHIRQTTFTSGDPNHPFLDGILHGVNQPFWIPDYGTPHISLMCGSLAHWGFYVLTDPVIHSKNKARAWGLQGAWVGWQTIESIDV